MLYTILSSDEDTNFDAFPRLAGRPAYSPGLRSESSKKNNRMIPDLCRHIFSDLFQKEEPFLVGDVKLHQKWNSSLGQVDDNNDYEIWYRSGTDLVPNCLSEGKFLHGPKTMHIRIYYNGTRIHGY